MPIDRKSERRLNTPLLPVLTGVFAILYGLSGYRGWLVFLTGLAGLWLLAIWWIHSLERGLHVSRRIHLAWATVGDSVPEQLEVINESGFPAIWIEIADETDALAEPLRLVSDVDRHATRRRYPVHQFKRRGLYTLGPTRLRTGDPFGIYTLTIHDRHSNTILVTPPQIPLTGLRVPHGGWTGDRNRRGGVLAREISDAGIRDYAPGDSLKRIHWRASAHHDALVVRQLEAAASEDWWILVDLNSAVQAGTGQDSTLELLIVLAASLAMRGLKEHRRVGLGLIGPKLTWLEPRGDLAHRWHILRALAMAEAGKHSLAELLSVGRPARNASLIVITPATDPRWVAATAQYRHSGSMTALLVDPADFGSGHNQSQLVATLAQNRIPFVRMPGSLLKEAYLSLERKGRKRKKGLDVGGRYWEGSESTWRSMD